MWFQTSYPDYLRMRLGVGYGGYYAVAVYGQHYNAAWYYDTEFVQIWWESNGDNIAYEGFSGYVYRHG